MKKVLIIISAIIISGCIDPYHFDIDGGSPLVIVDGTITTEEGPHYVKLFWSSVYGNNFQGVVQPLPNASLWIRDDSGDIELMTQSNEIGVYQTSASFSAKVGRAYSLYIELPDGRIIMSLPEKVERVPEIDSLSVRTHEIFTDNPLYNQSGAQVMVHFKDPADEKNYYQWVHGESVYVLIANPELHRFGPDNFLCPYCDDPKDCCDRCFRTEKLTRIPLTIADDESFNGASMSVPFIFIEDNGVRLRDTYRIDIQQRSLSQRAHRFLLLTKQQQEIEGNVFDPPPANIRSNLVNMDNPDESVLGYFMASDVHTRRIYIKNTDIAIHKAVNIIPDDCREVRNASLEPPDDWNP